MKEFKTLNNKTLQEGFSYLANKEPKFKKILEEKNYEINPFSKHLGSLNVNKRQDCVSFFLDCL